MAMGSNTAKAVLKGDAARAERWELPDVDGALVGGFGRDGGTDLPTAKRLEALQQQAWDEGFALGRREGRAQGQAEARARVETEHAQTMRRMRALFDVLAHPLAKLDEEVEQAVADLAMLVARHLVRRELKADPGEVIGVVREAIGMLPVSARNPRIHLNPEDVDLVREVLSLDESVPGWRIEADPLVSRGGCLVETATSFIDATVEARLAALIARAFGGDRSTDR